MFEVQKLYNDCLFTNDNLRFLGQLDEIVIRHELDGTYEYWENYCLDMLKRCDEMIVICLPGWTESNGVKGEMEFCKRTGKRVTFMEYKK